MVRSAAYMTKPFGLPLKAWKTSVVQDHIKVTVLDQADDPLFLRVAIRHCLGKGCRRVSVC